MMILYQKGLKILKLYQVMMLIYREVLKKLLIAQYIKIMSLVKMVRLSGIVVYIKPDKKLSELIKTKDDYLDRKTKGAAYIKRKKFI